MLIDQTFLRVHPATQAWWEQRPKCRTCAHLVLVDGHEGEEDMRCRQMRQNGPRGHGYCIDARAETGPCGPEAKLWEGKE